MKPNFLIIGAARSGTTSLFQYLDPHPQVYMSQVKELNFFSNEKYWKKGFDWYESRFGGATDQTIAIGEASTSYTKAPFTEDVPNRIYDYNPEMKLIYVIRDPIDRYISHYLKRVQNGIETRPFEDTLIKLEDEPSAWQGLYFYQISQYLNYFSKEQILLVTIDALKTNPSETIEQIYTFLGITKVSLKSGQNRVHNANTKIVRKTKPGQYILDFYRNHVEQTRIPFLIKRSISRIADIGGEEIEKPTLHAEIRPELENFYSQDTKFLLENFNIMTDGWSTNNRYQPVHPTGLDEKT